MQNLELQNLVLVPAQATPVAEDNAVATPDGRTWLSLEIRAFEPRQEQLEALERAASLSQSDVEELRDIVLLGFRHQVCVLLSWYWLFLHMLLHIFLTHRASTCL